MIAIETRRAAGLRHVGRLLVPVSRRVALRLPGGAGGLVWNRPLGVEVRGPEGRRFLAVSDPTRRIEWLLFAAGAAAGILLRVVRSRRERGCRGGRA